MRSMRPATPGQTIARRLAASAALVLAVGATLALGGCDPCTGVYRCSNERVVSASGRVIEFRSGRAAPGVRVTFTPTGGAPVTGAAMTAVSDGDGQFRFASAVADGEQVIGTLTVTPPGPDPEYSVGGLALTTSSRRGEGNVFQPLLVRPWLFYIAEFRIREGNAPVVGATATFVRQSGGRPPAEPLQAVTDENGRIFFDVPSAGAEPAVGTWVLEGGNLPRTYIVDSARVRPLYADLPVGSLDGWWQLGAALDGAARFVLPDGTPLRDADVEFVRTGGLPLVEPRVTARTNDDGWLYLPLRIAQDVRGEVIGDFTVRAAGQGVRVARGARVRTIDSGDWRTVGIFTVTPP